MADLFYKSAIRRKIDRIETQGGTKIAFEIHGAAGLITGENRELDGNPAGGYVAGVGFRIDWQDGPLGQGEDRQEPNGAFVEDVLLACLERMHFYQGESEDGSGRFRCRENALIITKVEEALHWGNHRTAERERRGVGGLNAV